MKKYNINDYKGPVYVEYDLNDWFPTIHVVNNCGEILYMSSKFFDDLNNHFTELQSEFNVVEIIDIKAIPFPEDAYMSLGWYSEDDDENKV